MDTILLFGAGKSATVLIDYLMQQAHKHLWQVIVVDNNAALLQQKITDTTHTTGVVLNIEQDATARQQLIAQASVVISLLPPTLHIIVAKDCIEYGTHLLTASYVDDGIRALATSIKEKGLIFLYEMGLDPGIDHMSAMQLIHQIQAKGGIISSFASHCGGLVAPESDTNPWHYKISWNPRNVVLAGKAGAVYKAHNKIERQGYEQIFAHTPAVRIAGMPYLSYYANRDSLSYIPLYNLEHVHTFIRTTLRHSQFIMGWHYLVELQFTNEDKVYQTDGMSIAAFFRAHLESVHFADWLVTTLEKKYDSHEVISQILTKQLLTDDVGSKQLTVNAQGVLQETHDNTTAEDDITLLFTQLRYLGMEDAYSMINKGLCSAADILQYLLETKLVLLPHDKDRVVIQHEITYTLHNKSYTDTSTLILDGQDNVHTAMATTVGLPLGIAAKLILDGTITQQGLSIPITEGVYEPVLKALDALGISFAHNTTAK